MLQLKTKLYLTIFLATIGFLAEGQSIVGLTGGYYSSSYYDYSEPTNHWGTYHSPSSYCITAFIKQRNHESINIGEEVSFVSKVLDLNATYMGLVGQEVHNDHFKLNYLYISLFPELS